jgi:arginine-tRNA-protein transferase
MHTRVARLAHLSAEELDRYLARGWYRIGPTMMTCRFVHFDGELRTAVWTRLDLADYRPRKSMRRTLNKVRRHLQVEVGEVQLDDEHEAVYQRYRTIARGERSATLHDFLYGDRDPELDVFDTREVRFRHPDGRLAGFSWFDVGADAIQSLLGVYDPDVGHLSVGFASMLEEIGWAQEHDRRWFYPGYVLPGAPAMDYKLRVGDMQFLRDDGVWRPYHELDEDSLATEELRRRLDAAQEELEDCGVPYERHLYPMFEAPAWHSNLATCLTEPLVLLVPGRQNRTLRVVYWDLERQAYRLRRCVKASAIARAASDGDGEGTPVELFVVVEDLATREHPGAIAEEAAAVTILP